MFYNIGALSDTSMGLVCVFDQNTLKGHLDYKRLN